MAYRTNEFEDRFYDERRRPQSTYDDVRLAERERTSDRDRLDFIRNDPRVQESGPLVLRQREVESRELSRPRYRSPSPVASRHHEQQMGMVRRARSLTPPHVHEDRERERIRIANRERVRYERSPSPEPVRYERRRSSSADRDRERIRIIQRERERVPERQPSPRPPSPPPQPPVVRGPTIEREVITHYRGIDHGVTRIPSPPPPPRPAPRPINRTEERQLEIDIATSRRGTNVGVRETSSRQRERSMERRSPHAHAHGSELVLSSDRDRLRVEDRHWHSHSGGRRRAHSAAPLRSPVDEEAEYITSRIDARGRHGEAWHGATKDWTIVDVPPGTERVRMDGAGGGGAEVTWQRYNGVRRAKFIPERDDERSMVPAPAPRNPARDSRSSGFDRELEIEISRDRRRGSSRAPPPPPKRDEMWTEITKDLCCREALMECGYEFEETEYFFYVMQYLKYDNVLELIQITESIRHRRHERDARRQWEREYRDQRHHGRSRGKYDERVSEREFLYDSTRMRRV